MPKTYSHLAAQRRIPTDYEIASSQLLYYPKHGFSVEHPGANWIRTYQQGSALCCSHWEGFTDPRETTYRSYVRLARDRESYTEGLLAAAADLNRTASLSDGQRALIAELFAPLRYPVHGLQMLASYLAHLAPSGRIVIAAMFQAADELRRVQNLARRLAQLRVLVPDLGADSRERWEGAPEWQPLREVIERLLVTYDWGEALVAVNVTLKPMFDTFFMVQLGQGLRAAGDELADKLFFSLREDSAWHHDWTTALLTHAVRDTPSNEAVIRGWFERWRGPCEHAFKALGPSLGAAADIPAASAAADALLVRALRLSSDERPT